MRRYTFLFFAASLSLATGCRTSRIVSDDAAQTSMIEASLHQFARVDPRPIVLGDELLFDSLKTAQRLDPSVKQRVLADRAAVARCPTDGSAPAGCSMVNVSLPVRAGTDTAIVYVSSHAPGAHSYVSRAYRFADIGGKWTFVGEVPH